MYIKISKELAEATRRYLGMQPHDNVKNLVAGWESKEHIQFIEEDSDKGIDVKVTESEE